jgi:hypothetical protein
VEERGVADHAVVEQSLVAGSRARLPELLVAEVELDGVELHGRPRVLGLDADLDTLVGLDVEDEPIGIDLLFALVERGGAGGAGTGS